MRRFYLSAAIAISYCGCWPSNVNVSRQEAYAMVAGTKASDPIPAGVKKLQADGAIWMDINFCCRFTASEPIVKSILGSGYRSIEWDAIADWMMRRSPYTKQFSPKWNPTAIVTKECFVKTIQRGPDYMDVVCLVLDRNSGVIYAVVAGPDTPPLLPKQSD